MEEEKEKIPTLEEALGETYDRMHTAEVKEPPKEEVKEEAKEITEDKPEKPRGKDGKFTGAENATKESQEGTQETTGVKPLKVSQAPASWTAEAKAIWDTLPPQIKAEAHRIERDTQKALAKLSTEKKQYEGLETVLAPRRSELAATYGDEATGLKTLFALSDFATKDPMGFIQYFAQQRGLNLASLNTQPQGTNPDVAPLLQKISQLEGIVNGLKTNSETAINSQIERTYNEFVSNPENIYLERVRDDMAQLLEVGAAKDWQDAYDKACWARPDVRELMLSQQRAFEDQARQKELEEKAKQARRISATNVATNGVNGTSPSKPKSIEDTMGAVWDSMHGAA